MRVLLIAYEFPPVSSAQALRWRYLAEELTALGIKVDVVAPDLSAADSPCELSGDIQVTRCFAGPYVGLANRLRRLSQEHVSRQAPGAPPTAPSRLQFVYQSGRRVLSRVLFPDVRAEWSPFARRAVLGRLRKQHYDVLVASHEPATDLQIGLSFQRRFGVPLVADLADPVLAPYTPRHWRHSAHRLEALCVRQADAILVTAGSARDLLLDRHGSHAPIEVVPQGFPGQPIPFRERVPTGPLRLLFTGTVYKGWRDPSALIEAIRTTEGVVLTIVGSAPDVDVHEFVAENIRWLGRVPHDAVLSMQRESDVLVSIGNAASEQVPGKLYEYLGAGKPILHARGGAGDPGAQMLGELGAGLSVANDIDSLAAAIDILKRAYQSGVLGRYVPSPEARSAHSWRARALQVANILERVGSRGRENQPR